MLNLQSFSYKQFFYGIGFFLMASIAGLWAWNTLAELFHWPTVIYKHVIAFFILLLLVRWVLLGKGHAGNLSPMLKHDRIG
ncbi:MAG: hypothetical protein KDF59_13615 [Nitrosomonas sp.]|nr:hypothetical protein [Nitrosomonas sp.]